MNFSSPSSSNSDDELNGIKNPTPKFNQSLFDIQTSGSPSGPLSFDEDLIASPHYLSSLKSSCSDLSGLNDHCLPVVDNKKSSFNVASNNGNYEIIWREEKIRILENERKLNLMRLEEYTKQFIQFKEEIKRLNNLIASMGADSARVSQLVHEKNSVQEYAEQLRLQKNGIQEQLNFYKQGVAQAELDKRNQQLINMECKYSELRDELHLLKQEMTRIQNDNDRLRSELNTLKINYEHKSAECEELTIMQDELLRAMAEEKKTVFEFQKLQFSENLGKEKLKKDNEKLELLVDQLKSEGRKFQEDIKNQSQQNDLNLEEQEAKFKKEIANLTSIVIKLEQEFRDKESYYQAQQLNSQEMLISLNTQLKDLQGKYETTVQNKDREFEQERHTSHEKSKKFKKELTTALEMIQVLKEANSNLESNFVKNSQIVSILEKALVKERSEKAELTENLEILKVKLPKMLQRSTLN